MYDNNIKSISLVNHSKTLYLSIDASVGTFGASGPPPVAPCVGEVVTRGTECADSWTGQYGLLPHIARPTIGQLAGPCAARELTRSRATQQTHNI